MPSRALHPQKEFGKLYQDQLYGAKTLSPLAAKIVDCSEFQRLAGLKQLGFSDVAYRGARHSRLEHSIGTYFICRQIMRRIEQNHERLDLDHPGKLVSTRFSHFPHNSGKQPTDDSYHARWRGLAEVISAAALLHDIGHVPFGHTLEDEFKGIFLRHDRLAGPRLHKMLFDDASELVAVFSENEQWLQGLSNHELQKLIYIILNWKEQITPVKSFDQLLAKEISAARKDSDEEKIQRLKELKDWYAEFTAKDATLFQPFMSDIVGNTICSDLLDYLPRDRMNLGMEVRKHKRLQRYFTIRPGTHSPGEGLRMSIMVTRTAKGGQRRDVASAVLNIMRERFEMAEGVYYHHKKCAASAMLAKLAEIAQFVDEEHDTPEAKKAKPRDDNAIYPAPWNEDFSEANSLPPHVVHLSDHDLIEYLGKKVEVKLKDKKREATLRALQRRLYTGLRYRRKDVYRTFMVVDVDLISTKHDVDYFVEICRGADQQNDRGRLDLELLLADAAKASEGDVIIYCAPSDMQAKEIDARLEIAPNKIVPLRTQADFTYFDDVKTLQKYYQSLWRAHIFVAPEIFDDPAKCRAIFDTFCTKCDLPQEEAFKKVRGQPFDFVRTDSRVAVVTSFWSRLPFDLVPPRLFEALRDLAANDTFFTERRNAVESTLRLTALFSVAVIDHDISAKRSKPQRAEIGNYRSLVMNDEIPPFPLPAVERDKSKPKYEAYTQDLFALAADGGVPYFTTNEVWDILEPLKAEKSVSEEIASVENYVASEWLTEANEFPSRRRSHLRTLLPTLKELFPEEELFGGRYKADVVIEELRKLLKQSSQ